VWDEVCDLIWQEGDDYVRDGVFMLKDGRKFALYTTRWGDGEYYDQYGHSYSVDAGLIGCIRVDDIKDDTYEDISDLGAVIEFKKPFQTSGHGGMIQIGHILIDTDPVEEEAWGDELPDEEEIDEEEIDEEELDEE